MNYNTTKGFPAPRTRLMVSCSNRLDSTLPTTCLIKLTKLIKLNLIKVSTLTKLSLIKRTKLTKLSLITLGYTIDYC